MYEQLLQTTTFNHCNWTHIIIRVWLSRNSRTCMKALIISVLV